MLSTIKNNTLLIGFLFILVVTLVVYSNHFHNPFFFDDSHTIVNNSAITSLENWTDFFLIQKRSALFLPIEHIDQWLPF